MKLPKLFLERHRKILDENEFRTFIEYLDKPLPKTIRINTLKTTVRNFLNSFKWDVEPVGFYRDAFTVRNKRTLGNTLAHFLGYIYIQEAASMLPPLALEPGPRDWVLDMCAAPGSKTTQIAQMMGNRGVLFANEVSLKRLAALGLNMQRCGVANAIVTKMHGRTFARSGYRFDKVLVDAPCSSEGALRKDYSILDMWNMQTIHSLSRLQRQLILTGFDVLKEGGTMVYSTCTLTPEENEGTVNYLLESRDNAKVEKIKISKLKSHHGIEEWEGKKFDASLKKTVKLYPQDNNTEGFYLAKVVKC